MRSFHRCINVVEKSIRSAKQIALMLDFDGTISAFAPTPQQARISAIAQHALKKMRGRFPIIVVSGRPLRDIRSKVGIRDLSYAGNHGAEWILGSVYGRAAISSRVLPAISRIRRSITTVLARYPGLLIEDKRLSIEFHFRRMRRSLIAKCKKEILSLTVELISSARLSVVDEGLSLEVSATDQWSKGDFSRHAMRVFKNISGAEPLPIYIGDAKTDEAAFEALKRGITIKVGMCGKSAACYAFSKREQVDTFLSRLEYLTRGR